MKYTKKIQTRAGAILLASTFILGLSGCKSASEKEAEQNERLASYRLDPLGSPTCQTVSLLERDQYQLVVCQFLKIDDTMQSFVRICRKKDNTTNIRSSLRMNQYVEYVEYFDNQTGELLHCTFPDDINVSHYEHYENQNYLVSELPLEFVISLEDFDLNFSLPINIKQMNEISETIEEGFQRVHRIPTIYD